MKLTDATMEAKTLGGIAARAASSKNAERTVILDVSEALGITDCFLVTSATNTRQVRAIVDEIERELKLQADRAPLRIEGLSDTTWVLMDYGDLVAHVFLDETREFYDLEHLWSGVPRIPWEEPTSVVS